jgi:hypothetical protein
MKFTNIIAELCGESSSLKSKIEVIPERNLKTGKKILESLTKLAFIQYVNGEIDDAEVISEKLSSIEFDYDYDYWTWVEFAISLRAQLGLMEKDSDKYKNSVSKILNVINSGEGFIKKIRINVHERFMAGEGVELDELAVGETEGGVIASFDSRLIYLMKLVKIKVLGGSSECSLEKIERDIESNISSMRNLLSKGIINKVQPFV